MTSTIKERPILFSGPMVRATLEGRKTVTRRLVKGGQLPKFNGEEPEHCFRWTAAGQHHPRYGYIVHGETEEQCAAELGAYGVCPHGKPGDRLWVRETCLINDYRDNDVPEPERADTQVIYKADGLPDWEGEEAEIRWRPSIHMPRWCSRILLEITGVRVERLQAGDGETAFESRYVAEGIHRIHHGDGDYYFHPFKNEPGPGNWSDPFDAWRELWVSVNGGESWNANPWVWVVEFKRVMP